MISEVHRNIRTQGKDHPKVKVMGHSVVSFKEVFSGCPLKLSKRKDVGAKAIFGLLVVPLWKCSLEEILGVT